MIYGDTEEHWTGKRFEFDPVVGATGTWIDLNMNIEWDGAPPEFTGDSLRGDSLRIA